MLPIEKSTFLLKYALAVLPEAFEAWLKNAYDLVFVAHTAATGSNCYLVGHECFFHSQRVLPMSSVKISNTANAGDLRLHQHLVPLHEEWYAQFTVHKNNWDRVNQIITSILIRAKDSQDIRDMFPDHFLRPVLESTGDDAMDFQKLRRTRPSLRNDPDEDRTQHWPANLIKMYDSVSGIIDMYVGYKLL